MKNIAKELGNIINTFLCGGKNCAYVFNPDGTSFQMQPGVQFILIDFEYNKTQE